MNNKPDTIQNPLTGKSISVHGETTKRLYIQHRDKTIKFTQKRHKNVKIGAW